MTNPTPKELNEADLDTVQGGRGTPEAEKSAKSIEKLVVDGEKGRSKTIKDGPIVAGTGSGSI